MKFALVTGPAFTVECVVCHRTAVAGDQPWRSASNGELVDPEKVYADIEGEAFKDYYCEQCAAKLSVQDPTRSVTQFYADTKGEEIDHKRLPE